ncbi:hypothetical protein Droror1_Dr00020974 [Drosera rotundifolia]
MWNDRWLRFFFPFWGLSLIDRSLEYRVKKAEEDLLDSQHALKCCFTQEGKELVVLNIETYRGLLEAENAYIPPMVKEDWLNFMDRNTKFFHDVIRSRRKRGLILSFHNGPGDIINGCNAICSE